VSSDAYALNPDMLVGGQAVLDGVMMRSARGYAVAVRRPDGTVAVDRDRVAAPSRRFPVLKLPVLRGSAVLLQSLFLGFRALSFAAHHSVAEEDRPEGSRDKTTTAAIAGAMAFAVIAGAGLFLFLPLLARVQFDHLVRQAGYPGSPMIPAASALLSLLALKLLDKERRSHIDDFNFDEAVGLFAGLNVLP